MTPQVSRGEIYMYCVQWDLSNMDSRITCIVVAWTLQELLVIVRAVRFSKRLPGY